MVRSATIMLSTRLSLFSSVVREILVLGPLTPNSFLRASVQKGVGDYWRFTSLNPDFHRDNSHACFREAFIPGSLDFPIWIYHSIVNASDSLESR